MELIRFLYADHGGVTRGKAASRSRLAERLTSGIGHTVAMMAMRRLRVRSMSQEPTLVMAWIPRQSGSMLTP